MGDMSKSTGKSQLKSPMSQKLNSQLWQNFKSEIDLLVLLHGPCLISRDNNFGPNAGC